MFRGIEAYYRNRPGGSLGPYLQQRIEFRFSDFVRGLRRFDGHYDRSLHAKIQLDQSVTPVPDVHRQDLLLELDEVLQRLSPRDRRLLCHDGPLRRVAAEMQIPYSKAKRRHKQLLDSARTRFIANP